MRASNDSLLRRISGSGVQVEVITSTQNKLVKTVRSLAQKKFRNETGLFLVEGIKLLGDMPSYVEPECVFATPSRMDEASKIFMGRSGVKLYCVTDEVMESLADTDSPYGIAAVCATEHIEFKMPGGNALLLDGVSDPGNLGTILRTAAACGFCEIYTLDCVDLYSPKVIRATLGALFKVKVYEVDEKQAIELVNSSNSVALDMGGANLLQENDRQTPVLFIAGSEAHGVRESIISRAKKIYSLPMKNQMESLNVAVATAVAMYQMM